MMSQMKVMNAKMVTISVSVKMENVQSISKKMLTARKAQHTVYAMMMARTAKSTSQMTPPKVMMDPTQLSSLSSFLPQLEALQAYSTANPRRRSALPIKSRARVATWSPP